MLRISESVRAYAYLVLSLQASARSRIIGNTESGFTAQKAFLNNFENVVNRRVDGYSGRYQTILVIRILTLSQELWDTTTKFSCLMLRLVWGKMIRLILLSW